MPDKKAAKAEFLLATHLVLRAVDRVFRVAEAVQERHPRVLFAIEPDSFATDWVPDVGLLPVIEVLVTLDDEDNDPSAKVVCTAWQTSTTIWRRLMETVKILEKEHPAPAIQPEEKQR